MKLAEYAERLAKATSRAHRDGSESSAAVAAAFELSFPRLEEEHQASAALLKLCAYLSPDEIPLQLIRGGSGHLPDALRASCASPEDFNEAVGPLLQYALARRDGESLFVHRLVQEAARGRLSAEEHRDWASSAFRLLYAALPEVSAHTGFDPETARLYDRLVPHGLAAATLGAEAGYALPNQLTWLFGAVGDHQLMRGDLATSLRCYQRSLEIAERLASSDPSNAGWQRDLSVSLEKLADVNQARGELEAAQAAYQRSLEIAERLASSDPSNAGWQRDVAVSFARLGEVAAGQGDLKRAAQMLRSGFKLVERLSADSPDDAQLKRDLDFFRGRLADLDPEDRSA